MRPIRPETSLAPRVRSRTAPILAVALVLLAAAARAGNLHPIDDFEVGYFNTISTGGLGSDVDTVAIPGYSSHCIWTERRVVVFGAAGEAHASLGAGPLGYDGLADIMTTSSTAWCQLLYFWGFPRDLTFAGSVDQIEMDLEIDPGLSVFATVGALVSSPAVTRTAPGGGRQTLVWQVTDWPTNVITQAHSIWFSFSQPPGGADYKIYDIRFRTANTRAVNYVGNFIATQTPPVPTPPLDFTLFDPSVGKPLYAVDVAITDAMTDAATVPAGQWTWTDIPGFGDEYSEMSFLWTEPGGVQETGFDFSFDVSQANGVSPDLFPPDPIFPPDPVIGAQSILLSFPVALRNTPGGTTAGVSDVWLSFDLTAEQMGSLEFQDVTVTPNPSAGAGGWTDGFTLHFRLAYSGMGSPDEQFPLFTATWISDVSNAVPTGVTSPAPAAGEDPLRLVAVPAVTRAATEIRASHPFRRAAEILIHDVTGRRIRSLPAPAGDVAVRWDGRNAAGRPVAAGVYFARIAGAPAAPARIVTVR